MDDIINEPKLELSTPAEIAIYKAIEEVYRMDANVRLAIALRKMLDAKNLVVDVVNNIAQPYTFNFGEAIEALKEGRKVAREGWNGKGMWLKYMNGVFNNMGSNDFGDAILFNDSLPKEIYIKSWIGMKCADGEFVPWLASQTDMLANDWQIV